jgi:VWFA-related protein
MVLAMGTRPAVNAQGASSTGGTSTQPTPTFRASVKLIDIDVIATDKDGKFIRDLTRDDFEILEDGKVQDLQTFSFVDVPAEAVAPAPASFPLPEPDTVSNATAIGRIFALLMDAPSSRLCPSDAAYLPLVRRVANSFIDDYMAPGDQAAVIHVMGTYKASQTFTASKPLLHAAVDRYGTGLTGPIGDSAAVTSSDSLDGPTGVEQANRQLETFRTIEDLATRLGSVSGRRKSILWIGAQLRFSIPACGSRLPPDPIRWTTQDCEAVRARWGTLDAAYRDAISAATRNNVVIHAVDPCGLTTVLTNANPGGPAREPAELDRMAALRAVAEDTGGLSVVGTNNFAAGFQNIVRESSTYYVLGYAPATEYRDGKFHNVQVRVKRRGVQVRARKGYTAPKAETKVATATPLPDAVTDSVRDALRAPLAVRGLILDVYTAPFRGTDKNQTLVVGGQISGPLILDGQRDISLSYQVFTLEGRVQTGEFKVFSTDFQPETRGRVAANGLNFADRISLPPGRYELRYAVSQPGGATGSVVASIDVPAFDEALSLSGIAIASAATSDRVALREDDTFRQAIGANPTSIRRFPPGDAITAYVEAYSNQANTDASDVQITATLTTADDKEVVRGDVHPRDGSAGPLPGRWGYEIDLPLDTVAQGNYVIRVEATSPRHKEPVRRRVPIVVD